MIKITLETNGFSTPVIAYNFMSINLGTYQNKTYTPRNKKIIKEPSKTNMPVELQINTSNYTVKLARRILTCSFDT